MFNQNFHGPVDGATSPATQLACPSFFDNLLEKRVNPRPRRQIVGFNPGQGFLSVLIPRPSLTRLRPHST
jgi:hypothetical protein